LFLVIHKTFDRCFSREKNGSVREIFHGRIGYYDRHFVFHMATRAQKEELGCVVLGDVSLFMVIVNRKYEINLI
jgi:hypothetical protein